MVERYPGQRSEYGGGDGSPQRMPDGSAMDLEGIAAATGLRARLLRQAGIEDFDPAAEVLVGAAASGMDLSGMSASQIEAYSADLLLSEERAHRRAELLAKTNGYSEDSAVYEGEAGEGNGVAAQ